MTHNTKLEPAGEADCLAGCKAALEECEGGSGRRLCEDGYTRCYRECERVIGGMRGGGEGI